MYDLIIIGGGPGGYVAAIRARQLGMRVALVEKEQVGGTCLNRGCIPTKAYYKNAEVMYTVQHLSKFGIGNAFKPNFDLAIARTRKDQIVNNLVNGVEVLLQGNGVEFYTGEARLIAPNKVIVGEQELVGRNVLLATGSQNAVPPILGCNLPGVIDSTAILELTELPTRLVIIGGGVIGMELAGIFNAFGSKVTVLEAAPSILNGLDNEIVKRFKVLLKKQGIEVLSGIKVEKIESGAEGLQVFGKGKKGFTLVSGDKVLLATGRKACLNGINPQKLGLDLTEQGFIKVNEDYATSVKGIYAIGDVIGGYMLAHVASEEGIIAVEKMAGLNKQVAYHAVPNCIFTFPEIASVGLSEEAAKLKEINYQKGKFLFAANGKAMGIGETDGLIKVLADENERIIGVHILGPHASDLILEATLMVKEKMPIEQVINTIHPHPTLGEVLHEAVLDVKGRSIHQLAGKR
jgi:dihydrolipoamide dehydrogenase